MDRFKEALKGYHLAMQISGMMVLIIFCSLFGGIWIDRKLGTTPWLMLILMVIGLVYAMISIYRIATENQHKNNH